MPCYWGEARPASPPCSRKRSKTLDMRQFSWAIQRAKDLAKEMKAGKEQIVKLKASHGEIHIDNLFRKLRIQSDIAI